MTEGYYLIAHKVRGEPAFDVATQMICPTCEGDCNLSNGIIDITGDDGMVPCHECDSLGYWWIIPTSGHRAYPWWHVALADIDDTFELDFIDTILSGPGPMPPGLPDHYPHRSAPTISLAEALGIRPKPAPLPPIIRRF